MTSVLVAAALSLGIGYSSGTVPSDIPQACHNAVSAQLERLKVDPAGVAAVNVIPQIQNPEFGSIVGYNAWVSLRDRPGALVIKMSYTCRVRDVYSRGGLTL